MLVNKLFHLCTKENIYLQCDPTQSKPDKHLLDLLKECENLTVTKDHDPPLFNSTGKIDILVPGWNKAKAELTKRRLLSHIMSAQDSNNIFDSLLQLVHDSQSKISTSVSSAFSAIDLICFHPPNSATENQNRSGLTNNQVNDWKNQKTSSIHDVEGKKPRKKQKTSGQLLSLSRDPCPQKPLTPKFSHALDGPSATFRLRLCNEMNVTYTKPCLLFCPLHPPDKLYYNGAASAVEWMSNAEKICSKL